MDHGDQFDRQTQRLKEVSETLSAEGIGLFLRHYRKRAGVTAPEAARALGRRYPQVIYFMENGKTPVGVLDLLKLLSLYEVPVAEAFTESTECLAHNMRRLDEKTMKRTHAVAEIMRSLPSKEQLFLYHTAIYLQDAVRFKRGHTD